MSARDISASLLTSTIPTVSIQGRSEMQSATYLCANGFFKATESVSDENTCLRHMLVGMPQNKVKVQLR